MKSSDIKVGHTYFAKLPLGEFFVRVTGEAIGMGSRKHWPCVVGRALTDCTHVGRVYAREVIDPIATP